MTFPEKIELNLSVTLGVAIQLPYLSLYIPERWARFGHADKSVIGKVLEMLGILKFCGEGGIRTHDTVAGIPPFQGGQFNRSCTSPNF